MIIKPICIYPDHIVSSGECDRVSSAMRDRFGKSNVKSCICKYDAYIAVCIDVEGRRMKFQFDITVDSSSKIVSAIIDDLLHLAQQTVLEKAAEDNMETSV